MNNESRGANENEKPIIPSTAILYRTNAQSRAIEEALLAREIPYRIFGGIKFYERREIKDIIAALRYAANPQDSVSRERLEKALRKSVWANLDNTIRAHANASPLQLINLFITSADYFDYIEKNFLNAAERRENISELIHFAAGFSDLPAFLEHVSLLQSTDDAANRITENSESIEEKSQSVVNLMTIHLAKGLEFDTVFIAGATEGLLPHARSLDTEAQTEEERRLMYVAMTRAKQKLSISFYALPSRFLSEIPEELMQFESLVSDTNVFEDNEERYITLD